MCSGWDLPVPEGSHPSGSTKTRLDQIGRKLTLHISLRRSAAGAVRTEPSTGAVQDEEKAEAQPTPMLCTRHRAVVPCSGARRSAYVSGHDRHIKRQGPVTSKRALFCTRGVNASVKMHARRGNQWIISCLHQPSNLVRLGLVSNIRRPHSPHRCRRNRMQTMGRHLGFTGQRHTDSKGLTLAANTGAVQFMGAGRIVSTFEGLCHACNRAALTWMNPWRAAQ